MTNDDLTLWSATMTKQLDFVVMTHPASAEDTPFVLALPSFVSIVMQEQTITLRSCWPFLPLSLL